MQADLIIILPEILISVYAMVALLFAAYSGQDRLAPMLTWLTAAVLVLIGLWIATSGNGTREAFGGMFQDDGFARFAKVVILLSAAAVMVMGQDYMERRGILRFEYPLLIALSASSGM